MNITLLRLALSLRLTLMRFGWSNVTALLLCVVAVIAWSWGVPYFQRQVAQQQRALTALRQSLQTPEPAPVIALPQAEQRLTDFYQALGPRRDVEQQIKTLFAIATKTGLNLQQAEYKSAYDKNSRVHTYQMVLPVKGSYGAIRQFCEKTLLEIPFASLDEISFKRDAIASTALEARLRLTLYLTDSAPPQGGMQ